MPTKRILSWSKRQSSSEPYYRTGGLLSIDLIEPESNDYEAKTTLKVEKRRPANLTIFSSDDKQHVCSPATSQYNAAVVRAATISHSASNHMLRSPVPSTNTCSRSASLQKPLPCRPRSASVPSIAELPAELPGSLLLENQGFPSPLTPVSARPTTQIFGRESHPSDKRLSHESVSLDALDLVPAQLNHTRSVPELSSRYSIMKTSPSGDAFQSSKIAQADPSTEPDSRSSSKAGMQRRSRPDLITSLSSTHGKASTKKGGRHGPSHMWLVQEKKVRDRDAEKRRHCQNEASSAQDSSSTRNKHIDELKATIATQDQTISILQSQFTSLRSSHEAHVASLVESHLVEVASLKNHIRALEEGSSKHGLHHVSSNNSLSVLDTTETPYTPIREAAQIIVDPPSASSVESESKQRSPQRFGDSPEMENLKRKLSSTRRPETTTRNLLPELNQYKQNNAALQQQIESLMAKLNESKKSERELRNVLGMTEMKCAEFEDKAAHADKLAKSMQALQNTIDQLESRLEIANAERLDAEEQLSNLRDNKSPFDLSTPMSQVTSSANQAAFGARMSTSTVFSGASPISSEVNSQENATLAAFVAHVERLQDHVREKDVYIANLEKEREQLRQAHSRLERDHNKIAIHSDIENGLLREAHRTDTHMGQLRTAVLNHESVIEEKERDICAVERQLEHHKLLLQAEIRRHAATKLHVATEEEDSWPELTSLARREDIDRWMDRLHERLRREQSKKKGRALVDTPEVQMESLRKEIDFYVREIILFKLDIKGYKSDIRKLKKITAQMEAYGRTSELESEACSLGQTATPVHSPFAPPTPELSHSPVIDDNHTRTTTDGPRESSVTTLPSAPLPNLDYIAAPRNSRELDIPATLQEMAHMDDYAIEADRMNCGASPHKAVPRSVECRKPTCGKFITSFPASNSAVPWRRLIHKRSMSEPLLKLCQTSLTHDRPTTTRRRSIRGPDGKASVNQRCSVSILDATENTPKRSSRTRRGLSGLLDGFNPSAIRAPVPLAIDSAQERSEFSEEGLSNQQSAASSTPVPTTTSPRSVPSMPNTNNDAMPSSLLSERKLSTTSSSSMPFVINMGSPYNPALIAPCTATLPTSCSVTCNAPFSIVLSPTSRPGIGGPMTLSTPMTSPVSPTSSTPLTPTRKNSLISPGKRGQTSTLPQTRSHSRNLSGSGIRNTMRF